MHPLIISLCLINTARWLNGDAVLVWHKEEFAGRCDWHWWGVWALSQLQLLNGLSVTPSRWALQPGVGLEVTDLLSSSCVCGSRQFAKPAWVVVFSSLKWGSKTSWRRQWHPIPVYLQHKLVPALKMYHSDLKEIVLLVCPHSSL